MDKTRTEYDFDNPNVQPELVVPEEEYEPLPTPYVSYIMLTIMGILFLAMAYASAWHFDSFTNEVADAFGAKVNSRILVQGHLDQWWRFVLPIFLHGGAMHLAVNGYSMVLLGRQMEQIYGSRKFLLLFLLAGIAGTVASFRFSVAPSLGASGALFGLVGAGIVFPLRFGSLLAPEQRKQIVKQLVQVAAVNLVIGFFARGYVDNAAHVGGLIGGAVIALFIRPDVLTVTEASPFRLVCLNVMTACAAMLIVVCAYRQATWARGPWWKLDLPAGTVEVAKRTQFGGEWKLKSGAMLSITDSVHTPGIAGNALGFLLSRDVPGQFVQFKGVKGRVVFLSGEPKSAIVSVLLVPDTASGPTGTRMLVMDVVAENGKLQQAQTDLTAILKSFRVLHSPPPDLHPILPPPAPAPVSGGRKGGRVVRPTGA